ncbi:GNAT family N-acetyltransferase [Neobacillus sp. YIM B06451]|uniref:GNAT family N-acetyltransferase n=1 Tax=Neobacillus sp. YIM B06451 TaxID=3070994 RepID=UPI00292EE048|nr:GNAT family N-acetyltransferase [Neobacillus sp. YIM B06451]
MIELTKSEFGIVSNLINETEYEVIFAHAVLDQNQPGRIFTDNIENPTVALFASKGGHYFLVGNPHNDDFNNSLFQFLMNQNNHWVFFDLYTFSSEWSEKISTFLQDHVIKVKRTGFSFNPERFSTLPSWKENIPDGFEMKEMDEALFDQYQNEMDNHFKMLWDSPVDYVKKGFGYCLLYEGRFASVCNCYYIGGGYAALDIITANEFQNKGLATLTSMAFIKKCLERDLIPSWECQADNLPSYKLASKLGFDKQDEFHIFWWHKNKKVLENYMKRNAELSN